MTQARDEKTQEVRGEMILPGTDLIQMADLPLSDTAWAS